MGSGKIKVEPTELDAHGKQVGGVADALEQAKSAGQTATPLGSDAFGLIGQPFAAIAQNAVSSALQELGAVTQTARQLSNGVCRAGEAYHQTDDGAKKMVDQVHERL